MMSSEDWKKYSPTDPELIDKIVNNIKSKGIFDQFRKDCLADVDTKPAYQNLQQRVTGTVTGFLATQKWQHGLNKTQLRESLRRHTVQQAFLEVGVDRIVDQVVNPKVYSVFTPKVEDVVCELLGIEKPKPKPLPLALNFQKFKQSLEAQPPPTKAPTPAAPPPVAPSPEPVKEEKPDDTEKLEEIPVKEEPIPTEEKPPEPPAPSPVPSEKQEVSDETKEEPVSPAGSPPEVVKNDDDSNTIDEMPLLAASLDSESNGENSMGGAAQNSFTKIGALSDLSNSQSPLSRPPLEFENSSNNLSKSSEKISPSKKFDNFSNLDEKLKQADVNLRETSSIKKEDVLEECSDVTKSSENDTESSEIKMDLPSESNMSSVDAFRQESTKMDSMSEKMLSDDSQSSTHSLKRETVEKKDERSRSHKREEKASNSAPKEKECKSSKVEIKEESVDSVKDGGKHTVASHSSKHHSKSRSREDKSKSSNEKDKQKDEKHKSHKEKSHNSDKNGKSDGSKERSDKKTKDEKKSEDAKANDSNKQSDKKREEEKSRHHSKDSKDLKRRKKSDDNSREKIKSDKDKSSEYSQSDKDKSIDKSDKSKKDSKSSRSKSDDRKHKDDKKKDDSKKDSDEDKKKSPRKRKSGRCDDDEIKPKNSRRSSDRDSNGNAGGGSGKSKPSSSSSHNGKRSSKSEKGRSHTKNKESANQSDAQEEGSENEEDVSMDFGEADEVDMILMEINNSIQNEEQRLSISEVLCEPSLKKPKIAKNFHEIKKIMQARKDIDRRATNDVAPPPQCYDVDQEVDLAEVAETEQENALHSEAENEKDGDDKLDSSGNSTMELKNCSIVVTDVFKAQLKNSSIESFQNQCIMLEDGVVKNVTPRCTNPLDASDADAAISKSLDTSDSSSVDGKRTGHSSDDLSSREEIEQRQEPVNEICSDVNQREPVQPDVNAGHTTKTEALESNQDKFDDNTGPYTNNQVDQSHESLKSPSCSSESPQNEENQHQDTSTSTNMQMKSKKLTAKTIKSADKSSSDETAMAPTRSKRSNAGSLMYAILGMNDRNLSSKSTSENHNARKKETKDAAKNVESVTETNVSSKADGTCKGSQSDIEPPKAEEPSKSCTADDGSDVSNKENDETKVTGRTRSQNVELGSNEVKETRATRRKTLVKDLNSTTDNNNVTKGRASLKCKISREESESINDEIQGKMDVDARKHSTSLSSRSNNRKGATPLNSRNEFDKGSLGAPEDDCPQNPLVDKNTFSDETRKSLESLHMDKENITVPVEQHLICLSQRRKSCPDVFDTPDDDRMKSSSNDKVSNSAQQEKHSVANVDKNITQSAVPSCLGTKRSTRRSVNAENDRSVQRDSEKRLSSKSCSTSKSTNVLPKRATKKPSTRQDNELICTNPMTVEDSIDQSAPCGKENHVDITISSDSVISSNANTKEEPAQVMLYFEDSPVISFSSEVESSAAIVEAPIITEGSSIMKTSNLRKSNRRGKSRLPQSSCTTILPCDEDSKSDEDCKGFTDYEIVEATKQLRLLQEYIANRSQAINGDEKTTKLGGQPRTKKTRVASEDVETKYRIPRKRNFSLTSSPEKDKKEDLGRQCKAESKDSGLCESPEQLPFASAKNREEGVVDSGEKSERFRKITTRGATSTPETHQSLRNIQASSAPNNPSVAKTRTQRYSTTDLYKPRPVIGRETRLSKPFEKPTTTRGRTKRST